MPLNTELRHTMRALVPSKVRDYPGVVAILKAVEGEVTKLEEMRWDVHQATQLSYATGRELEEWGDIVGEPRGLLSPPEFRRLVYAAAYLKSSAGTVADWCRAYALAMDAVEDMAQYFEAPPYSAVLEVTRETFVSDEMQYRVYELFNASNPLGYEVFLVERLIATGYGLGPSSRTLHARP